MTDITRTQTAYDLIQTWEYRLGSRVVIANRDRASEYYTWRLYVDGGAVATLTAGQAKTLNGMERGVHKALRQ